MQTWLRTLQQTARDRKSARKSRQPRAAWRGKIDGVGLDVERLEDRLLLAADVTAIAQNGSLTAAASTRDLAIGNQEQGPTVVNAGGTQTYTLTVSNSATTAAMNVTATDLLAAGATNASISGGPNGTIISPPANGAVTATIPTLAPGQNATFTVTAKLNTPGVAFNVASVEGLVGGTNQVENTATVFCSVNGAGAPAADLKITVSTPTVAPDGAQSCALVVTNTDAKNTSFGVVVTDVLPDGASNVTATGPSGVTFTIGNEAVTASIPSLAPGTSDTLTLTGNLPTTGSLANEAFVEAATQDDNQSNNYIVPPPQPFVDLKITASTPTIALDGTESYALVVTNTDGTNTSDGVTVTDVLPNGARNVTATGPSGVAFTIDTGLVTASIPSLAPGATDTLTVTEKPPIAGNLTNTAVVGSLTPNGNVKHNYVVVAPPAPSEFFIESAPGDGTVKTEITNLYWSLLGRAPDPAGLQSWLAYGQANMNARGDQVILSGFLNSLEYKTHYVKTVYETFLGRAPDAGALAFWTAKMGNPGTPGGVTGSVDEKYMLAAILGSDEFYNDAGGTPGSWINALYEDLLGRAADQGGMSVWQQELSTRGAADRDGIVSDLLSMPEVVHDLLDAYYPAAGGAATTPLAPPGAPAGTGMDKLALLTGGGWENLYFAGPFGNSQEANDAFFAELVGGAEWDVVQYQMLTATQFFSNQSRR